MNMYDKQPCTPLTLGSCHWWQRGSKFQVYCPMLFLIHTYSSYIQLVLKRTNILPLATVSSHTRATVNVGLRFTCSFSIETHAHTKSSRFVWAVAIVMSLLHSETFRDAGAATQALAGRATEVAVRCLGCSGASAFGWTQLSTPNSGGGVSTWP